MPSIVASAAASPTSVLLVSRRLFLLCAHLNGLRFPSVCTASLIPPALQIFPFQTSSPHLLSHITAGSEAAVCPWNDLTPSPEFSAFLVRKPLLKTPIGPWKSPLLIQKQEPFSTLPVRGSLESSLSEAWALPFTTPVHLGRFLYPSRLHGMFVPTIKELLWELPKMIHEMLLAPNWSIKEVLS